MGTDDLSNRPWLLLPGTLCTQAVFDGFLDVLKVNPEQRQDVQMEWPSVEDYRDTFENLPEGAVVCGFSLGALVAAHHADRMRAHSLILFGVNPFPDDPVKEQPRRELARDVQALGGAVALRSRPLAVYGQTPKTTADLIYKMADISGNMIVEQTELAISRPGAFQALANATMPVLSLTGSLDQNAPYTQGQAAAQAAPDGRFDSLEGLGHFALLEDPIACAAAVAQLMERQNDTC